MAATTRARTGMSISLKGRKRRGGLRARMRHSTTYAVSSLPPPTHHFFPSTPTSPKPPTDTHKCNSKPRIVQAVENTLAPKKTTKANTSKPRTTSTTKTTSGRVTKPATVKKPRTKTEKVVDKIVGKGEKVVGDVEGKPGKKVC